jgi:DNA-binding transcriptional MerR regulator
MFGGGLSGLIFKIKNTILLNNELNDEIINEIISKYPLSKSSLRYLLTLYEELENIILELKEENKRLDNENKRLESKKVVVTGKYTQDDLKHLQGLLKGQKNYVDEVEKENQNLKHKLEVYDNFFLSSFIGTLLYKNYCKKQGLDDV